jgi:ElaB/YqjD/DUF883 family membrane-anchored ribosome-binding protein
MDRESPELIEREMEQTRESLTQKVSLLENKVIGQVEDATDTVHGTIESVQDTVQCVKTAVEDTVQSVTDTVKHSVRSLADGMKEVLDVRRHTINHPLPMVGGAAAVGFLTGLVVFRRPSSVSGGALPAYTPMPSAATAAAPAASSRPGWLNDILEMAGREVKQIAQQVIAQASTSLRQTVQARVPHLIEQVVPGSSSCPGGSDGDGAQFEGGMRR